MKFIFFKIFIFHISHVMQLFYKINLKINDSSEIIFCEYLLCLSYNKNGGPNVKN